MSAFDRVLTRARQHPRRIVLPEPTDERVLRAAAKAVELQLAVPLLLGEPDVIEAAAASFNVSLDGITLINASELPEHYISLLQSIRAPRKIDDDEARKTLADSVTRACIMVNTGDADGCVAGAITPTADVVRAALRYVRTADGVSKASSFFIMLMKQEHPVDDVLVLADCALSQYPDEEELAQIAAATGDSAIQLLQLEPQVGMLSFSTAGSARHAAVTKVQGATLRARALRPTWRIIGDVQLDAAVLPELLKRKAPEEATDSPCNILIFPNLDAGNIGYKLIERFGGAQALGPVLQGLKKPVNDLSRGCNTDDIVNIIAITAAQCVDPN